MFRSPHTWVHTEGDISLVICPRVASESIREAVGFVKGKPKYGKRFARFVRNPYDRAESLFYLHSAPKGSRKQVACLPVDCSFLDYCREVFVKGQSDRHYWSQCEYFEGPEYSFTGRLENFPDDWDRFREWSGWDVGDLPHKHKSEKRDIWCAETRGIVMNRFRDDFDEFGY